tara:strand:- start:6 stop:197 length:192 start_codon:yes stop_codon:yes gene_type:complete
MPRTPEIKDYYQNVKSYLADRLMRAEQQLRRAEDNDCPPEVLSVLHHITKLLRRLYKDLILFK